MRLLPGPAKTPGSGIGPTGAIGAMGTMGGASGMGARFMEPTNWEIELALHNIKAATTEAGAAKAAAGVYRVGLDPADVVVNAFEEKVAKLRHPNWNRPMPPRLPRSFRPLTFIIRAWKELQALAKTQAASTAAFNPGQPPHQQPGNYSFL